MAGAGNHIAVEPAGPQHPEKLLQGQGGEAVDQQVDLLVGHRQVIDGGHGKLNAALALSRPAQGVLGEVHPSHPGVFSRLEQGLEKGGAVISLSAAGVQDLSPVRCVGQRQTGQGIPERVVIAPPTGNGSGQRPWPCRLPGLWSGACWRGGDAHTQRRPGQSCGPRGQR